jgi:hypothetical protein
MGATAPAELSAVICFATSVGLPNSLVKKDQTEVSPLSRGVMFQLLSIPLQDSLRFFRPPVPAMPSPFLAVRLPPDGGAQRVYPVDCRGDASQRGWGLFPGGDVGCCCQRYPLAVRPTVPFWRRRCRCLDQPLAPFPTDEVDDPSPIFNLLTLPWAAPALRLAGYGLCPQGFAHIRYQTCTPG